MLDLSGVLGYGGRNGNLIHDDNGMIQAIKVMECRKRK